MQMMNIYFSQIRSLSKQPVRQGFNRRQPLSNASGNQSTLRFGSTSLSCEENELFSAAKVGRIDIVTQLLKKGVDVNIRDPRGNTPLHWAAAKGNQMTMGVLLSARMALPNPINHDGYSPLAVAVLNGQAQCVDKMLIPRFAVDVNRPVRALNNDTPLLIAIGNGDKEIVEQLLRNPHININIQNNTGETALMRVAETGQLSIAKILLSRRDLDVNLANKDGETARQIAFQHGHDDINKLIWERQDRPFGESESI